MARLIFSFLVIILFCSCNRLEKKLSGGWLIERVYYNNRPVKYDLYTNSFDLNKDNTCSNLPISPVNENQAGVESGTWKSYIIKGESYLQINTKNQIFNRKFRIIDFREESDYKKYGYLLKMTIVADSVKIICAKVPTYR
jgi:hypothetical protein